jgi:hypothetical protein
MTDLPPDPKSDEEWKHLPQNPPSKDALPPLFSGGNVLRAWWFWMFVAFAVIALISVIGGRL